MLSPSTSTTTRWRGGSRGGRISYRPKERKGAVWGVGSAFPEFDKNEGGADPPMQTAPFLAVSLVVS